VDGDRKPATKKAVRSLVASIRRSGRSKEGQEAAPSKQQTAKKSVTVAKKKKSSRKQEEEDIVEHTEAEEAIEPRTRSSSRPKTSKPNDGERKAKPESGKKREASESKDRPAKKARKPTAASRGSSDETGTTSKQKAKKSPITQERVCRQTRSASKQATTRCSEPAPRQQCSDFLSAPNFTMVGKPFDSSKYTRGIADHDKCNKDDTIHVANYVTDLYQRYYDEEVSLRHSELRRQ